jgi:hypothetical protein
LRAIVFSFILLGLASTAAQAQFGVPWHRDMPKIIVVGTAGDARSGLADQAAAFWNKTLGELGARFRLGAVTHVVQTIPEEDLQAMSNLVLGGGAKGNIPESLRGLPGDITIFLAQSEFVSFTGPFDASSKRVIGIRGAQFPPMTLPNVPLNVITHELGHAIGLGHNSDPAKLMCGRPAPCRPAAFRSDTPHIFPLTEDEKRQLRAMYGS